MELSVVIPAFKAEASLESLVAALTATLDQWGRSYEIVFIDDASPDATWEVLCRLQSQYPDRIALVQLNRNFGQHNALMCGFRHARGKLIATMDDDLQHPPGELPKLLALLEQEDFDLVYGGYRARGHHVFRQWLSIPAVLFYQWIFRTSIAPTSFRVMKRELVESILYYQHPYTVIDGLLAWNTHRIGRTLVEHEQRRHGRSTYTPTKLVLLALNLFTNFSLLPLRAAWLFGAVSTAMGVLFGAANLFRDSATTATTTTTAVLFIGGIQLLTLALMGEYLGRLHLNVNQKPQYIERQVSAAAEPRQQPPNNSPET